MKWILKKENDECSIKAKSDDGEIPFSYIEMIKELYENKKLEAVEYDGDFSETEKESVDFLVNDINEHVRNFFENNEENLSEEIHTDINPYT